MNLKKLKDSTINTESLYDLKRERLRKQFLESDIKIVLSLREASVNSAQKLQDIVDDKVEFAYKNFIKTRK